MIGMSWATGAMTCYTEAPGTTTWGQETGWRRMWGRMSIMAGMATIFLVAAEAGERMSIMARVATIRLSRVGIGSPTSSIAAKARTATLLTRTHQRARHPFTPDPPPRL